MAQATAMLMTNNTMNNVNYNSSSNTTNDISNHHGLYWPGMMATADWRDKIQPLHG